MIITKEIVNRVNDEPTKMTTLEFEEDEILQKDGLYNTLNGRTTRLVDILWFISSILADEVVGAEALAELEPNTLLSVDPLELNEDLYDVEDLIGVENPAIKITEENIDDAIHSVKQFEYLLLLINLMINGANKFDRR